MKNFLFPATILTIFSLLMLFAFSCTQQNENKTMTKDELVAKGKYLVNAGGCNDCHSPKVYTDMGPVPDSTRLLSGYPQGEGIGGRRGLPTPIHRCPGKV
ncbi:MAG: hypothetical protein P8Y79_12680 [Ignavibacteriaceae bacterium]